MTIYLLNCYTCNMRPPGTLKTGMLVLLIEGQDGLILVDTGPGLGDHARQPWIMRLLGTVFSTPGDERETAIHQVRALGYNPEDVRDIVVTHLHFDHCGGMPDFPWARVHVNQREYAAFRGEIRNFRNLAYVPRHLAHAPEVLTYVEQGDHWFELEAMRLPFRAPEMWLVPLYGHTVGQSGVAIRTRDGWFLHAGDGAALENDKVPEWFIQWGLGPNHPRLRALMAAHPEVTIKSSHMWLDYFEGNKTLD